MAGTIGQIRRVAESYFGIKLGPEILDQLEVCGVSGGDWLFREGEEGDSFYMLVRGRLQVLLENNDTGAVQLPGEVVAGESVGEAGLSTGE